MSVDTIRFYQKRGLLAPPERDGRVGWYSDSHLHRLAEIRSLQDHGLPLAVIGTLGDPEDSSPIRSALARARANESERGIAVDDAAASTGIPAATIRSAVDAGLIGRRTSEGEVRIGESDLTALAAGAELLAAGVPLEDLIEVALTFDHAARHVAARAAELFDVHVRTAANSAVTSEDDARLLLAAQFERLLDVSERLVGTHIRRALLDAAEARANEGTA